MVTRHPLDNSPPRLSDLEGDELRAALLVRDKENRAAWMAGREPKPSIIRRMARRLGIGG